VYLFALFHRSLITTSSSLVACGDLVSRRRSLQPAQEPAPIGIIFTWRTGNLWDWVTTEGEQGFFQRRTCGKASSSSWQTHWPHWGAQQYPSQSPELPLVRLFQLPFSTTVQKATGGSPTVVGELKWCYEKNPARKSMLGLLGLGCYAEIRPAVVRVLPCGSLRLIEHSHPLYSPRYPGSNDASELSPTWAIPT
jgi:hypothetical protein